jgi:hypothetical protein
MIRFDTSQTGVALVSNPGVVRSFRVQVRESGSRDWRMHSSFRHRTQAESCVVALQTNGVSARLVDCDRCPTAI